MEAERVHKLRHVMASVVDAWGRRDAERYLRHYISFHFFREDGCPKTSRTELTIDEMNSIVRHCNKVRGDGSLVYRSDSVTWWDKRNIEHVT